MEEDRANVLEMLEAQMAVCRQIDLALEEDVLEGPRRTELLDIRASHMDAIGRLRSRLQEEGEVSQSQARSQQRPVLKGRLRLWRSFLGSVATAAAVQRQILWLG